MDAKKWKMAMNLFLPPYEHHVIVIFLTLAGALSMGSVRGQSLPFAASQPATLITSTGATLNGMGVRNGTPAVAWFEWGALGSFDQQTGAVDLGAGTAVVSVAVPLAGLTNAGIYQSRLVVSNALGVTRGFVQLFTTGRRLVGWNSNGQIGLFTSAPSNIVVVSAAGLALTSDNGRVVSWNSGIAQTVLTNAVCVSGGIRHNIAVLSDGTVTVWGENSETVRKATTFFSFAGKSGAR